MGCQSSKNMNAHFRQTDIELKNKNYRKFLNYYSFLINNPNSIAPLIKGVVGDYWDLGVYENKTWRTGLGYRREHIRSVLRTVPYAAEFRVINNIDKMTTKKHMMDYIDYLANRNAIKAAYYVVDDKPALRFCVHDWGFDAIKRNWCMRQIVDYDDNNTIEALLKLKDRRFSIIRHRFAYRMTRLGRGM